MKVRRNKPSDHWLRKVGCIALVKQSCKLAKSRARQDSLIEKCLDETVTHPDRYAMNTDMVRIWYGYGSGMRMDIYAHKRTKRNETISRLGSPPQPQSCVPLQNNHLCWTNRAHLFFLQANELRLLNVACCAESHPDTQTSILHCLRQG